MSVLDQFWFAWPWMGLGVAVVMVVLLFSTDLLRGGPLPRWRDPVWLAWSAMPAYLVHQFEEYALHTTDGQFDIIQAVSNAGLFDLSALPMAHFPVVNIALVWFAVPLAAYIGKKLDNPVVGLAPYGFILANGLLHVGQTVTGMAGIADNPGFFTGAFVFLPLSALVIVTGIKYGFLTGKGLAIALTSGVLGHVLLGGAYAISAIAGPVGVITFDLLTAFAPVLLALLGSRIFLRRDRTVQAVLLT